jgi:hypothetical protein
MTAKSSSASAGERIASGSCLFCHRDDRPFTAQEHPFPEGLGNQEIVLPPGIVCDPCNHGPLSQLDQAFLDFPPIAFIRVTRGISTKSGSYPVSRWGNAVVSQTGPDNIHVRTNSKHAWVETGPELGLVFFTEILNRNPADVFPDGIPGVVGVVTFDESRCVSGA